MAKKKHKRGTSKPIKRKVGGMARKRLGLTSTSAERRKKLKKY